MGRTETLAEALADVLRRNLREGLLVCGDRLAESHVAKDHHVSQNTARDALRLLEQEGWLARRPRHGITVRAFSAEEAETLYTIRAHLEALSMRWAFERFTEQDKAALSGIIGQARIHAGMSDLLGVQDNISAFHHRLLALAQRPLLHNTLQPILNQTRLLVNLRDSHTPHADPADQLTRYGDLITHIRYGERAAAGTALHDLIRAEGKSVVLVLDLLG